MNEKIVKVRIVARVASASRCFAKKIRALNDASGFSDASRARLDIFFSIMAPVVSRLLENHFESWIILTDLNEEQLEMQGLARKFAREEIMPVAAEHDRTGEVNSHAQFLVFFSLKLCLLNE